MSNTITVVNKGHIHAVDSWVNGIYYDHRGMPKDFNFVIGDGVYEERFVSHNYTNPIRHARVCAGIELIIEQADEKLETAVVRVAGDRNLIHYVNVCIDSSGLNVAWDINVKTEHQTTVFFTPTKNDVFHSLVATSAAELYYTGIPHKNLDIDSRSGARVQAIFKGPCDYVSIQAESGSNVICSGAEEASVTSTDGAGVLVEAKKKLQAGAFSGGVITYYGEPTEVFTDARDGGKIILAEIL